MLGLLSLATLLTLVASPLAATEFRPALAYDLGGKFDKSFNEVAHTGAEAFKAETRIAYHDFEIHNGSQREQAMRRFARDGHDRIVAIGFSHGAALVKVCGRVPRHALRHCRQGGRPARRPLDPIRRA